MKVLRVIVTVVAVVAAVATGVGAVIGAGAFAATFGVSLSLVTAIGTVAGLLGSLIAPKPKSTLGGSQTDFKLDPKAAVPIHFGRTFNGGNIVARDTWGADNQYQGFVVVYSGCGPIAGVDAFHIDRNAVALGGGGAASGQYANFLWAQFQNGNCPEAAAVPMPIAGFPGWGAASKLSGMAAGGLVFKFDKDGKKWAGGIPRNGIVGRGVKCYDPRLDSTYPGGAGPCRADDCSTWVESRNGALQALSFALGWKQNGKPVGGVQAPVENIDVAAFVQAANVAQSNGWETGTVFYTGDPKWGVLRALLQSIAAEPIWLGSTLSVRQARPRVSVGTVRFKDLRGDVKVVGTQTRRGGRVNGLIPVYRSEDHGWEQVPGSVIRVGTYVAEDGEERTREIEFPAVQDLDQAAQLAAYEIVNGREIGPVSLPLGPEFAGVTPGMCIDLDIPEASLTGQWEVLSRTFNLGEGMVNLECRSETAGKHAFALGTTTTAPPTPSLVPPDFDAIAQQFETQAEAALAIRNSSARGAAISATDAGASATINVTAHFRDYPDRTLAILASSVTGAPLDTSPVFIYYDDATRSDTTPVLQWTLDYEQAVNDAAAAPFRHYLGWVTTPATGAGDTGGYIPPYSGGGGFCVDQATEILMADGSLKLAGNLAVGDYVGSRHHVTMEWGEFRVSAVEAVSIPEAFEAMGLVGSPDHRVHWSGKWCRLADIGEPVGPRRVIKISVEDGQTYISNGLLSHNVKEYQIP